MNKLYQDIVAYLEQYRHDEATRYRASGVVRFIGNSVAFQGATLEIGCFYGYESVEAYFHECTVSHLVHDWWIVGIDDFTELEKL